MALMETGATTTTITVETAAGGSTAEGAETAEVAEAETRCKDPET